MFAQDLFGESYCVNMTYITKVQEIVLSMQDKLGILKEVLECQIDMPRNRAHLRAAKILKNNVIEESSRIFLENHLYVTGKESNENLEKLEKAVLELQEG